jgi:hypothetical protein
MNKDAMNQGVQILLERMDTNPEEFEEGSLSKWADIMNAVTARKNVPEAHAKNAPLPFLTDPEVNALYDKLEDVRRENFTADVLRRLADTPQEITQQGLWDKPSYSTSNVPHIGGSLTTTLPHTTGSWGTNSITTAQALSLSEREKQKLYEALEDYNDKINIKEHEKLHQQVANEVKKKKATPR